MKMRFIGDVHGKFSLYLALTDTCEESIQVGDFGVGFGIEAPIAGRNHRFIRGNHDNPEECNDHVLYLGDWGTYKGIFFAGGAFSIDRACRVEGRDWWRNEELTYKQMMEAGDLYVKTKPDVVVTHCCPRSIERELFDFYEYPNPTILWLESLLLFHVPKVWIFGHYHLTRDKVIDGCRYICLGELEYIDLPIPG